jgi:hypothetical protein
LPALQPKGLGVEQLTNDSGFVLSTKVGHDELPLEIKINMGYFGLNADVDSKPFLALDMPSGLHVQTQPEDVGIQLRAILSHEETVAQRAENVFNALSGKESSSSLGITNLRLGSSESSPLVTFSKIYVEVPASMLKGKLPAGGSGGQSEPKTLASLTGAKLEIQSGTQVDVGVSAQVHDFPDLSLKIGTLALVSIYLCHFCVGLLSNF